MSKDYENLKVTLSNESLFDWETAVACLISVTNKSGEDEAVLEIDECVLDGKELGNWKITIEKVG